MIVSRPVCVVWMTVVLLLMAQPLAARESPLAGTDWRLVEFQSMDDAIGTIHPVHSSRYTVRLNRDGTAMLRLACGSFQGTWSATADPDRSGGHFEFGPLTATSAACPLTALDRRIVTHAPFVRSYILKEGRLYLSLFADGGIYIWEPHAEEPFRTVPDPKLETAILQASPDYNREVVGGGELGEARYVYGQVDLNGDGRDEVFVYLLGSIFCGTGGCNLLLFTDNGNGYSLVNEFPISRLPIIVSPERTEGWHDLVRPESGGGAPASYVRHAFDGERYLERDRLPGAQAPEGTRYLTGVLTFDKGIPLELPD